MGTKHFLALMSGEPLPAVPASRALMAPEAPPILAIGDIDMATEEALPEHELPDVVAPHALSIPPVVFERD